MNIPKELTKLLRCSLCRCTYSMQNPSRFPKELRCYHTFCAACVELLNGCLEVVCPRCGLKTPREPLDDLPTNEGLMYLLKQLPALRLGMAMLQQQNEQQLQLQPPLLLDQGMNPNSSAPYGNWTDEINVDALLSHGMKQCPVHVLANTTWCHTCQRLMCLDCSKEAEHTNHEMTHHLTLTELLRQLLSNELDKVEECIAHCSLLALADMTLCRLLIDACQTMQKHITDQMLTHGSTLRSIHMRDWWQSAKSEMQRNQGTGQPTIGSLLCQLKTLHNQRCTFQEQLLETYYICRMRAGVRENGMEILDFGRLHRRLMKLRQQPCQLPPDNVEPPPALLLTNYCIFAVWSEMQQTVLVDRPALPVVQQPIQQIMPASVQQELPQGLEPVWLPMPQAEQQLAQQAVQPTVQQAVQPKSKQETLREIKQSMQPKLKQTVQLDIEQPVEAMMQQQMPMEQFMPPPIPQKIKQPLQQDLQQPFQPMMQQTFKQPLQQDLQQPFQPMMQQPFQPMMQPLQQEFQQPMLQPPMQQKLKQPLQQELQQPFQPMMQQPVQPMMQQTFKQPLQQEFQQPMLQPPMQQPLQQDLQQPFQPMMQQPMPVGHYMPQQPPIPQKIKQPSQKRVKQPKMSQPAMEALDSTQFDANNVPCYDFDCTCFYYMGPSSSSNIAYADNSNSYDTNLASSLFDSNYYTKHIDKQLKKTKVDRRSLETHLTKVMQQRHELETQKQREKEKSYVPMRRHSGTQTQRYVTFNLPSTSPSSSTSTTTTTANGPISAIFAATAPPRKPVRLTRQPRSSSCPVYYLDMEIERQPAGRILIEVRNDVAPLMAQNFRALILHERGFGYKGCDVFQAWANESIVTGDFELNTGTGGYAALDDRFFMPDETGLFAKRGTIGMRRGQKRYDNCGFVGSQFRLVLNDISRFTAIFGYIVSGIDVLDKIANTGNATGYPLLHSIIKNCGEYRRASF